MEQNKRLWWLQELGLDVHENSKKEWLCVCPFCGDEKHLFLNSKTLLFDCKKCNESGNYTQLMAQLAMNLADGLTSYDFHRLAKDRKLPVEAFKGLHIGFTGKWYTLPVRNTEGKINNVLRYKPGNKLCDAPECKIGLFGAQHLSDQSRKNEPVYLLEGPWDVIAFDWLRMNNKAAGIVVGVLGAGKLPHDYVKYFTSRPVYVIQDNDDAGYKGEAKIASMLTNIVEKIEFYRWHENDAIGKDVRDIITEVIKNEM